MSGGFLNGYKPDVNILLQVKIVSLGFRIPLLPSLFSPQFKKGIS